MNFLKITPPFPQRSLSRKSLRAWFLGLGISGVLSILFLDQTVSQWVTTQKHPWLYRPVRELTEFAEGKYYFVAVSILLVIGWITQKKAWKEWGKFSLYALIFSGLLLQILKHLVGRQRPHVSAALDPHVFHGMTGNWHFHSFPSGHAQTVFSFATILWLTYPQHRNKFFALATAMALTRLPLEEHFLSDVIAGAILGIGGVLWVARQSRLIQFESMRNP